MAYKLEAEATTAEGDLSEQIHAAQQALLEAATATGWPKKNRRQPRHPVFVVGRR